MEALKLSEEEQQCYGKLFSCCDPENVGYVSWNKASELFRASHLPLETLSKITDLCGVKRVGQFKRSQFYIALRLIAAAQTDHSIDLESLPAGIDLPLPTFSKSDEKAETMTQEHQQAHLSQHVANNDSLNNTNVYAQQQSAQLPPGVILPPPPNNRGRTSSQPPRPNTIVPNDADSTFVMQPHVVSQVAPSGNHINATATESAPQNSSTPTSPNILSQSIPDSLHDKTWVSYSNSADNQPNWMQFEEHHQLLSNEEDSSDRHSSDDDDEDNDPFTLTEELRKYYTEQFKSLQPDLDGVIPGNSLKEFFKQSGLPNQELSKIWQHADVDRDGALSLEEFFIAMHLVVLRRNKIELPDVLPPSLLPQMLRKSSTVTSPISPSSADASLLMKEKQWTKFNESPVSSVSSPSMKPVNFDFPSGAVEQDPKILHPVPLRLSPDQILSSDDGQDAIKLRTVSEPIPYKPLHDPSSPTNCKSPKKMFEGIQDVKPHPSQAIQRPTPRKPSAPGRGAIPPPPSSQVISPADDDARNPARNHRSSSYSGPSSTAGPTFHSIPKKEPPPPPPPRPKRNHARSSSLDLNRLGKPVLGTPPAVPPRVSPGIATPKKLVSQHSEPDPASASEQDQADFADFTQFANVPNTSEIEKATVEFNNEKISDNTDEGLNRHRHLSAPLLSVRAKDTKDKKDLQIAIKAYRQSNSILSRLNGELNQELSESMEERIALEIQLERLKPFSS